MAWGKETDQGCTAPKLPLNCPSSTLSLSSLPHPALLPQAPPFPQPPQLPPLPAPCITPQHSTTRPNPQRSLQTQLLAPSAPPTLTCPPQRSYNPSPREAVQSTSADPWPVSRFSPVQVALPDSWAPPFCSVPAPQGSRVRCRAECPYGWITPFWLSILPQCSMRKYHHLPRAGYGIRTGSCRAAQGRASVHPGAIRRGATILPCLRPYTLGRRHFRAQGEYGILEGSNVISSAFPSRVPTSLRLSGCSEGRQGAWVPSPVKAEASGKQHPNAKPWFAPLLHPPAGGCSLIEQA